jgi:hypothetical protein
MQSDRAAKRADRRDAPNTTKHDGETSGRPGSSQQGYVSLQDKSNFLEIAGAEFTKTEGALHAIKRVTSNQILCIGKERRGAAGVPEQNRFIRPERFLAN